MPFSTNAMIAVEKSIVSDEEDKCETVRKLIEAICVARPIENTDDSSKPVKPTENELRLFTAEDIERFAQEFLDNNKYLTEGLAVEKQENEINSDFLVQVLKQYHVKQQNMIREAFAGMTERLGGLLGSKNLGIKSVSEELMKQTEGLKDYSRSALEQNYPHFEMPRLPPIPSNPAYETNDHLREMAQRLENLVLFGENALRIMNGLQVAAAEFLNDFSQEAEKNSKTAKRAIWVGIFAVLLSVFQILYSEFWRVPQDSVAMDSAIATIQGEIDQLQMSIAEGLSAAKQADQEATRSVLEVLRPGQTEGAELERRIVALLEEQSKHDQEIVEALAKLADTLANPVR